MGKRRPRPDEAIPLEARVHMLEITIIDVIDRLYALEEKTRSRSKRQPTSRRRTPRGENNGDT